MISSISPMPTFVTEERGLRKEKYKVIGFLYAMTLGVLRQRRDYWSTEDGLFSAPAFGRRFGMGLHRFEDILMALSFVKPENNDDKWYHVRTFLGMCTSKWKIYTRLVESMFDWYGRGAILGRMPAVMKIKESPKVLGVK